MVKNIFSYDLGIKQIFGQCGISENCFSTNEIVLVYETNERVISCISFISYKVEGDNVPFVKCMNCKVEVSMSKFRSHQCIEEV